jgi:hypothetical protein
MLFYERDMFDNNEYVDEKRNWLKMTTMRVVQINPSDRAGSHCCEARFCETV